MSKKLKFKKILRKTWYFIWHDDSILSWIVNIILALVIVKFIIYPGLGLVLGTQFPIVAVVSSSMEHNSNNFEEWWDLNSDWYLENNIPLEEFQDYRFKNGFNKGDIMVLTGTEGETLELGDVLVFQGTSQDPIIHRVVDKRIENNKYEFTTKGDNNPTPYSAIGETSITEDKLLGKAIFRIPLLGWIKIMFVNVWR